MLIERLFNVGVMKMGPSRLDPERQVGVFNPEYVAPLPALRSFELEKFRWVVGEWTFENEVPATRCSPAYGDVGSSRFSISEKSKWICMVSPEGEETPCITFDPFSKQWIYMLFKGSYGILRSRDGWEDDRIVFTGLMTMIGITLEWRMTWMKEGEDQFSFVNEEQCEDGSWLFIDQWQFNRKA